MCQKSDIPENTCAKVVNVCFCNVEQHDFTIYEYTWRPFPPQEREDAKADYDKTATMLRDMFRKNFNDKGFASLGIEAKM